MKKIILFIVFCTSVWSVELQALTQPSFECNNVKEGSIEHRICADTNLSTLDQELHKLYHSFYLLTPELKQAQRNWLKIRNTCQTNTCIAKAYENRIVSLQDTLNIQKEFPKEVLDIMILHDRKNQVKTIFSKKHSEECKSFYDDLFLFKNVKVLKPTLYKVDYNNTQLKEEMESCWDMGMNYSVYPSNIDTFSIWHSTVDSDNKKDFIFGQNYLNSSKANIYILDKELCKNAISKPKFNFKKDRKYVSKAYMNGNENIILAYQGRSYILEVSAYRSPASSPIRTNELLINRVDMETLYDCTYTEHKK